MLTIVCFLLFPVCPCVRSFVRSAAAAVHAHVSYSSCVRVAFDFSLTSSPQATIDMFENDK